MRIEQIDTSINLDQSIIWEYDHASALSSLITQKQAWYQQNQQQFWDDWYTNVFNLVTANDFGLNVWSIILDVPYLIFGNSQNDKPIWGFNSLPVENSYVNFNRGTFVGSGHSSRIILSTEEQRIFLRLRYFKLISAGIIPETNRIMQILFDDPAGMFQGGAYVIDNLDMTMTYVFNCNLTESLYRAMREYDVLVRPAGVQLFFILN